MQRSLMLRCAFLGTSLLALQALAEPPLGQLKASYSSLFAKESTAVTFTYFPASNPPKPGSIFVVEVVDTQGKRVRTVGELADEGFLGDVKAHDGIYGRKFQLNEKKPGTMFFRVVDESVVPAVVVSNNLSMEIVRHPAFQELLSSVWQKIVAQFH